MRVFFLLILVWLSAAAGYAHEVRPAYLLVTEQEPGQFSVAWKQPLVEQKRLKIYPLFPDGCEETSARKLERFPGSVVERWDITCPLNDGLITLQGLDRTLTDSFVEIDYLSGDDINALLKPDEISLDLAGPPESPAAAYLNIGIWHVLMGWDHLLFVLGLVLLVRPRQVIGVATSFTVAHSLTLAITALGWVSVPSRPVEILIAASIVFLAIEIIRKERGQSSLATKRPWIIAFFIGLVHGFGFAGALADIGLPKGQELLALFLFNIGVEVGQIVVIITALLVLWLLSRLAKPMRPWTETLATYIIGTIGMFWVIDRVVPYFA